MALNQTFAGAYLNNPVSFTIGNTTLGKILVPRTASATVLDSLQPDLTLRGGCRLIGGQIASTDGTARSMLIYEGHRCLVNSSANAPLMVGSSSTIMRASGSFLPSTTPIVDNNGPGWQVGDTGMLFGTATGANNGLLFVVTGVSSSTLTVNGTPLTTDATPGMTTELYRVALRTRIGIPLNSGNTDSAPAVNLFGSAQDVDLASQPDRGIQFGPDDVLIGAMVTSVSALPAAVTVTAHLALY